jgi:hypothetical protein
MPRKNPDLPLFIRFGQVVFRARNQSESVRVLVTEVDPASNTVQASKILDDFEGEKITGSGTTSYDQIAAVTSEIWEHARVAKAFVGYLGLEGDDAQWHYDAFEEESKKPSIILKPQKEFRTIPAKYRSRYL